MEKIVSITFKTLALSMLFMFLLDTSLLVVEIISIHSKVSNMTGTMQTELARNNYMPENMAETFTEFLVDIADSSSIMTEDDVSTNFSSLTADNAKEYGEIQDLEVSMTLHPAFAYYNPKRTPENQSFLMRNDPIEMKLEYNYKVPCLRYLK